MPHSSQTPPISRAAAINVKSAASTNALSGSMALNRRSGSGCAPTCGKPLHSYALSTEHSPLLPSAYYQHALHHFCTRRARITLEQRRNNAQNWRGRSATLARCAPTCMHSALPTTQPPTLPPTLPTRHRRVYPHRSALRSRRHCSISALRLTRTHAQRALHGVTPRKPHRNCPPHRFCCAAPAIAATLSARM